MGGGGIHLGPPSSSSAARAFGDRRWLLPFFASLLVSLTLSLALAAIFGLLSPPQDAGDSLLLDVASLANSDDGYFARRRRRSPLADEAAAPLLPQPEEEAAAARPRIAYLITGTKGDSRRMKRALQAVYHPRNQYILHLDLEAPPRERIELAVYVRGDPTFARVENVRVIAKANLVTYKGPTMIACTLHAVALLLKESLKWDWFVNLSASDYPLVTQDGQYP